MYRVLLLVFVKFADFNGRISRRDFCISTGLCLAVTVLVVSISHLFGLEEWWFLLAWIGMLLLTFTSMAVRRLHDVGRSGWWVLQVLAPILLINYLAQRGGPLTSVNMLFSTIIILLGIPVVYTLFLPSWAAEK